MKKNIIIALLCAGSFISSVQAQTVTFKPNATIGKDAEIWMLDNNCLVDSIHTGAELNYGNAPQIKMAVWTYGSIHCGKGTSRSLLRFDQLNTIPSTATITSVELRLYGTTLESNTWYTGHPASFYENSVLVSRITSAWQENTVTYNTRPSTTTVNSFIIPASTSEYSWNYSNSSNDLLAMVQYMVSNPDQNYGFMFQLQTENPYYRRMVFASSDYSDSTLWPELRVTYRVCGNFSMCGSSDGNFNFDSYASSPFYIWTINGNIVANTMGFHYNLEQGNNEVCLTSTLNGDTCTKCVTINVGNGTNNIMAKQGKNETLVSNVPQGKIIPGDIIEKDEMIKIYPNPTKHNWKLYVNSSKKEDIDIYIINMNGDKIYSSKESLNIGENNLILKSDNYKNGTYILKVKGNTIDYSQKIIKE
ncbi:MAG: DNRLRE domain-containing protein [Bacteroidales bacterium]|jgi:hypothetical protein